MFVCRFFPNHCCFREWTSTLYSTVYTLHKHNHTSYLFIYHSRSWWLRSLCAAPNTVAAVWKALIAFQVNQTKKIAHTEQQPQKIIVSQAICHHIKVLVLVHAGRVQTVYIVWESRGRSAKNKGTREYKTRLSIRNNNWIELNWIDVFRIRKKKKKKTKQKNGRVIYIITAATAIAATTARIHMYAY